MSIHSHRSTVIRPGLEMIRHLFHFHIVGKDVVFIIVLPRQGTTPSDSMHLVDMNVVILVIKPNYLQLKVRYICKGNKTH